MMGQTSRKLHDKLTKMAAPLDLPTGKIKGRADIPSIESWIKEGMDPVHAAYAFVQNHDFGLWLERLDRCANASRRVRWPG
jgi:hypothetical protein